MLVQLLLQSKQYIKRRKSVKKSNWIGLVKFSLLHLNLWRMVVEKVWNTGKSCFEEFKMIFRNTSWSSIYLFNIGYMYSFAHIGDMDFSFNWTRHFQQSNGVSKVFTLNEWRGRCWSKNVWFTKLIADAQNLIVHLGLAAEEWVLCLLGKVILLLCFIYMCTGAVVSVAVKEAIIDGHLIFELNYDYLLY